MARAAREEAEVHGAQQKELIKTAVKEAKEEGFPSDVEEKERYFMNEVARGETLCQDGMHRSAFRTCPPIILIFACRGKPSGGSTLLLQSSEGLSPAGGFNIDIRQNSTETNPRHIGRDDCI